jgi:hypothetical protein
MWSYPDMVNGTCKASMLLVTGSTKLSKINIPTEIIKCHQSIEMVLGWSDIHRNQREYISTGEE